MSKVFIFGENLNDTRALRHLVVGLRKDLSVRDVRTLRDPPTLQRGAHKKKVGKWAERVSAVVAAASATGTEPVCVLAHSDSDSADLEGNFEKQRTREMREAGLTGLAVVPVQAIEAWWLLFPLATESVVPGWRGALRRNPGLVDSLPDPKRELIRRTEAKAKRRPYQESDSVEIAAAIVARGELGAPAGASPSFLRFVESVEQDC